VVAYSNPYFKGNKMKSKGKKTGFTIVELLVVMSVIVILLSLLLPSLNIVRRYARVVAQKNQFRNIDSGLILYESDFDEYPDSSALDTDGNPYCGAMKLAEVMAGQDGLGFHLDSRLTADDGTGETEFYPEPPPPIPYPAWYVDNLRRRKEYLEVKDIRLCSLNDIYGTQTGPFVEPNDIAMLSDVFKTAKIQTPGRRRGKRIGMPILYYRADTTKLLHDIDEWPNTIYNYLDNHELLFLGLPWNIAEKPPLWKLDTNPEGEVFYINTRDRDTAAIVRPHNKDTYILISAGWDGIYGTRDDIYNFRE